MSNINKENGGSDSDDVVCLLRYIEKFKHLSLVLNLDIFNIFVGYINPGKFNRQFQFKKNVPGKKCCFLNGPTQTEKKREIISL